MKGLKPTFLSFFFISLTFPLYAQSPEGSLVFRSGEIDAGLDAQPATAVSPAKVNIYAEGIVSQGKKQPGIETIELEQLGVVSSDLVVTQNSDETFSVDYVLKFQHWGGKETSERKAFSVAKGKATGFLAASEAKTFRQNFVESVLQGMSENPKTSSMEFVAQFQYYLERFLQELAIKQQSNFIATTENFKSKSTSAPQAALSLPIKKLEPNKTEIVAQSPKTEKISEMPAETSEPEGMNEEEESLWAQLHKDSKSSPEILKNPVAVPVKTEDSVPIPQAPASQDLNELETTLDSLPTLLDEPGETQREVETTTVSVPKKEVSLPVILEETPEQKEEPEETVQEEISKKKEEPKVAVQEEVPVPAPVISKSVEEIKPEVRVERLRQAIASAKANPIPAPASEPVQEKPAVPSAPVESGLASSFQPKTPFHVTLARYQVLQEKRNLVPQNSKEYVDISMSMAELKVKLQTMGYFQKKLNERNTIEKDVQAQLGFTS